MTPCSHYMRTSTDGGLLTYPCVLPGCITKAILLDSVLAFICRTQSDWPTDPLLPEKLKNSKLWMDGRTNNAFHEHPMQSQ